MLGLTEIFRSTEDGTVGYRIGEMQITISADPDTCDVEGWSKQLGWVGGSTSTPSWGLECPPDEFCRIVEAAQSAQLDTLHPEPQWVGYWSFPMRDPMGYTVEISTPERDAWPPSS